MYVRRTVRAGLPINSLSGHDFLGGDGGQDIRDAHLFGDALV